MITSSSTLLLQLQSFSFPGTRPMLNNPRGAPGAVDYGLLMLLALVYGSAFLFIKFAVQDLTPTAVVLGRLAIGLIVFLGLAIWAGEALRFPRRVWLLLLASGLFGNALPFWLIAWGQEQVDSGLAAILMAPMPLATLVIAHFATHDEPMVPRKLVGVALGIAGVVVLVGIKTLGSLGTDLARQIAILGAGICYAINAVITKGYAGYPTYAVLTTVMAMSLVWMLPLVPAAGLAAESVSVTSVGATIILGLVQTAFGALLGLTLVRRQGAGFFGQINILVPMIGAVLGAVLLTEPLGLEAWAALAMILAGVMVSRGKS